MNVSYEPPEKPPMRKGRIFAIVLFVLLDVLLVVALILFFPFLTGSANRSLPSTNWSGYVVATNLNNPHPSVTEIEASWTVPAVSVSRRDSFSAVWIGIGGEFDGSLIQIGTEQDSINGVGSYSAWYELLPNNEVTVPLNVSPGDRITASISLSDPSANTWLMEINDSVKGQYYRNDNVSYPSSMLSAEWILERPTINNVLRNLADFSELTFTGCAATVGGKMETISSLPHIEVTLYNQNTELASVSPPASNGSSFTINYMG
jgi:hypothetical protein